MALFNISNIKGNENDVKQDVKEGDGCAMKMWAIVTGVITIIGTVIGFIAYYK